MRSDARKREATPSEAGEFPAAVSDADLLATPEEAGVVPDWPLTEAEEKMVYRHMPAMTPGHVLAELATDVARIKAEAVQAERERIAREIQAAKPPHLTRNYTPVDAAYDDAARIARSEGR